MHKYLINIHMLQLIEFFAQASSTAPNTLHKHNNACMEWLTEEWNCTMACALLAHQDFMHQHANAYLMIN